MLGVLVSVLTLSLLVGTWVCMRYGGISIWLILTHMHESPTVLPLKDFLLLLGAVVSSVVVGALVASACHVLARTIPGGKGRSGLRQLFVYLLFYSAFFYCFNGVWGVLDSWFAISYEIECRSRKSDFFKTNFVSVDPASVTFSMRGKNLLIIVSESLEEGFSNGMVGNGEENLLPSLVDWRRSAFHASIQRQVSGANYTSAALTALMYGIPRQLLDGSVRLQDHENYPRFCCTSIWDVFLANGYQCEYIQGGNFKFGSKGRLFPENGALKLIGFDDLKNDSDYLKEPDKHTYGVNDEVMFKHLKEEVLSLQSGDAPFVLMALTMNTHCPDGWRSSFKAPRHSNKLAAVILDQDAMIADFLKWFESLPCAKDTVVVVLGDHLYWGGEWLPESERTVFNAVKIPWMGKSPFKENRIFATFDWAPTFIELAGGIVPGDGSFGLGKSLLRDTPTVLEKNDLEYYESEIRASHADYWRMVLD